jgi:hypothetical protein
MRQGVTPNRAWRGVAVGRLCRLLGCGRFANLPRQQAPAAALAALTIEVDADRIRRRHGRANRLGFENLSHLRLDSS